MGFLFYVKKWLVFDGLMDDIWLESMGILLDFIRVFSLL